MPKTKIILKRIQIKNIEKAKKLAFALNIIEEECGIKNTEIIFKDVFVCEWIDLEKLNETEMELLIKSILQNDKH